MEFIMNWLIYCLILEWGTSVFCHFSYSNCLC